MPSSLTESKAWREWVPQVLLHKRNFAQPKSIKLYNSDETLIKFKGRVHFRQFLPLKHSRFRLEGFVIANASTGYVLNKSIKTGKEGPAASKDLAMHVVLNLTEPYAHKGSRCLLKTGIQVYPSFWNWKEGVYLLAAPWEVTEFFCLKRSLTSKMNRWKDSREGILSFVKAAI